LTKVHKFCGEVYYKKEPKYNRAGLDIKFLPKVQGKGLATEAFQLLINHIFNNEPEINAVLTEPFKENVAARKLYSRYLLSSKETPKDMESAESYWELSRKE
jgi:RimJ/RimL family protein N-acetyltransferase